MGHLSSSFVSRRARLAAMLLALASCTDGFTTPLQKRAVSHKGASSNLHLIPEQGSQLVAAFNAASATAAAKAEEELRTNRDNDPNSSKLVTEEQSNIINITHDDPAVDKNNSMVASAARAVISRIFSIPGAVMGRHPAAAPAVVGGLGDVVGSRDDDVILYPIVGFQFVQDAPNHVRVLPTVSNPSCRIINAAEQEVYGWYCAACKLDAFDSDHYCDGYCMKAANEKDNLEENS